MAKRDLTGAVDFAHLAMFAGDDQQVIDEVLAIFREQASLWLRLLDPDTEGWRDAAHTLKGAALGIGANELGAACAAAETAQERSERALRLDVVRGAVDRALADISAYQHEMALRSIRTP